MQGTLAVAWKAMMGFSSEPVALQLATPYRLA